MHAARATCSPGKAAACGRLESSLGALIAGVSALPAGWELLSAAAGLLLPPNNPPLGAAGDALAAAMGAPGARPGADAQFACTPSRVTTYLRREREEAQAP